MASHQQPGVYPPPGTYVPQQGQTVTVIQTGNCPTCHTGVLVDEYTPCGIVLAICFFPIGILCCLAMKENRCTHCGATF